MLLVALSLLAGGSAVNLTGRVMVRRMVYSIVNPICGLSAYSGENGEDNLWQRILREILSAPVPLFSWLDARETAGEVPADPVYERYLSSEVLYNGTGGPLLLNGGSGEAYPGADWIIANGQEQKTGDEDNQSSAPENDGLSTIAPVPVATHLPQAITGSLYTMAQLRDFDYLVKQLYFVHSSTTVYPYQLDADTLLAKDLTITHQTGVPQILIHHTHGTEDFADSGDGDGKTILEVGDYLAGLLESYGYTVIHDRSVYPYDSAYSEASAQVRKILAEYPSIEVVIDLHRDATGTAKRFIAEVDGETVAQLMFFNGMCQTAEGPIDYLNNPYLEDNLAFSLQMKLLAEAYYPGLTRSNFLKAYQYNQHLAPRYTLVEAGTDTNTFDEVCRSMVPLAAILDAVLRDPNAVRLAGE